MRTQTLLGAASLLAVPLFFACTGGTGTGGTNGTSGGTPSGVVVSPATGLSVSVALAAAHLGAEKCTHDESQDATTQSCAAAVDGGSAPRGTGPCGSPCDYSNMQLTFSGGASGAAAHVHIVSVTLLDASSGADLEELGAYTPLSWDGAKYAAWDETVGASAEVKASYTLAPPEWSTVDPSSSYDRQYEVRIVVSIDGANATLDSAALSRDPPVAT